MAWTKTLGALPSGLRLRFVSSQHDESRSTHLLIWLDCIVRPHRHDGRHQKEICERASAPIGDALFAAAIVCLAEARVKVRELNVMCTMTGQFQWEAPPGWGTCDLSRMQSFIFQPEIQETEVHEIHEGPNSFG